MSEQPSAPQPRSAPDPLLSPPAPPEPAEVTVVVTRPRGAGRFADDDDSTLVSSTRRMLPRAGTSPLIPAHSAVVPAPAEQHPVSAYRPRALAEGGAGGQSPPRRMFRAPSPERSGAVLNPEEAARALAVRGRRYAIRALAALVAVPLSLALGLMLLLNLPG